MLAGYLKDTRDNPGQGYPDPAPFNETFLQKLIYREQPIFFS
jgi:hypothetical protein